MPNASPLLFFSSCFVSLRLSSLLRSLVSCVRFCHQLYRVTPLPFHTCHLLFYRLLCAVSSVLWRLLSFVSYPFVPCFPLLASLLPRLLCNSALPFSALICPSSLARSLFHGLFPSLSHFPALPPTSPKRWDYEYVLAKTKHNSLRGGVPTKRSAKALGVPLVSAPSAWYVASTGIPEKVRTLAHCKVCENNKN